MSYLHLNNSFPQHNIYCCSFYGSSIWDLSSQCGKKLYTAWNTAINVPRDMHSYLIESISQCLHVKSMLASRCVSFYENIQASSKLCIRFLSNLFKNYLNTVFGRNLFYIANNCFVNLSDLSKMLVQKQMKYFDVPLDHAWKVLILQEHIKYKNK